MRSCVVCGARVRNLSPKVVTCSPICSAARDCGISRERALRIFPKLAESEARALNAVGKAREEFGGEGGGE